MMRTIIFAIALTVTAGLSGCMLMMAGHAAGAGHTSGMGCGMDMDHGSMAHDSSMRATHDSTKHAMPADTSTKRASDSSRVEPMQMDHMHMEH